MKYLILLTLLTGCMIQQPNKTEKQISCESLDEGITVCHMPEHVTCYLFHGISCLQVKKESK